MYDYICPGLVARVFPSLEPAGSGDLQVTEATRVDDGLEVVGIHFADLRYLVVFADVPAEPGGEPPAPNDARFVTVVRVEADHGTMFLPDFWRLPCPHMVWQFCDALLRAARHHVQTHPWVREYVCVSQTRKMDVLCERVIRQFTRGDGDARLGRISRPAPGKEGIYGFARHESCPA